MKTGEERRNLLPPRVGAGAPTAKPGWRRAPHYRGFTLLELLIAISILALVSVLIYAAFAAMRRTRDGLERIQDRYREGRIAMQRITRELSSAYLSLHVPTEQSLVVLTTAFIGQRGNPADRVDFNAFANTRRDRDSHESDQAELSYYGLSSVDGAGTDLVRRVSTRPDLEPTKGGRIEVLATDIDLFDLEYLDPQTGLWTETWDSTSTVGQPARLPLQVRITLVLNSGRKADVGSGRGRIRLVNIVALPIRQPLNFATL